MAGRYQKGENARIIRMDSDDIRGAAERAIKRAMAHVRRVRPSACDVVVGRDVRLPVVPRVKTYVLPLALEIAREAEAYHIVLRVTPVWLSARYSSLSSLASALQVRFVYGHYACPGDVKPDGA